jgi:hypothetical protein
LPGRRAGLRAALDEKGHVDRALLLVELRGVIQVDESKAAAGVALVDREQALGEGRAAEDVALLETDDLLDLVEREKIVALLRDGAEPELRAPVRETTRMDFAVSSTVISGSPTFTSR